MKSRWILILILTILSFVTIIVSVSMFAFAADEQWQEVGTGITYREFQLGDPNKVYVARMDRLNPNVFIESSIAQGKLSEGLETVSNQAKRYDNALNYWGPATIPHSDGDWGARNQVVVAINGTFTLPPEYQQPWEGQVHSGWYAWQFQDSATRNAFVWKMDRNVFIGDCVRHPSAKQLISYATGNTQEIDGINVPHDDQDEQLILYTPQYDRDTGTNNSVTEVLVEMTSPTLIMHPEQVSGIVREIRNFQGSTLIPFDHIVLSGRGTEANRLKNNVEIGDTIGVSQFIRNCDDSSTLNWSKTYASVVSNDFYFLRDGQYQYNSDPGANVRNPRTAVAYNAQYVFFIVVDGRYPGVSIGMTMEQLASFTKTMLDADHGLSLDGGGSSTIVVNGEVKNFPSDGVPQTDTSLYPVDSYEFELFKSKLNNHKHFLPFVHRSFVNINPDSTATPTPTLTSTPTSTPSPTSTATPSPTLTPTLTPTPNPLPIVERAVPNGLMMVVVIPEQKSTKFQPGDNVVIESSGNVNLRLGPGTNYHVIESLPSGSQGVILQHINGLNGVQAKGYYWWKVKFGSLEGWIVEQLIKLEE